MDVHVGPESFALAHNTCLFASKGSLDEVRDLDRVRVRYARVEEGALRDGVDGRWEDDVGARIALCVCLNDEEIDVPVERGGRDRLELLDVQVRVDGLRGVFAPCVIGEETRSGLTRRQRVILYKIESRLTVWIRIGRSPRVACLFLRPLKIALAAGSSSASA